MRGTQVVNSFSRGPKKYAARTPQLAPFPFQELLPLKLKNSVSGKSDKNSDVGCIQEMTILFACFKKNEFNQALCSQEINNFQKCFTDYSSKKRLEKLQDEKGVLTPGTNSKNFNHKQINQLLNKYGKETS